MRVRMMGLGPTPISREKLTAPKLARALRNLTTVKSYRIAAAELGDRLRTEHGVITAANLVEKEIRRWLTEEPQPEPTIPFSRRSKARHSPSRRTKSPVRAARHPSRSKRG